ncbi:SGNH hydrolase-type esterase domain-containing protein [Protomyces lactucae-debilis]|uniref:SGNH hydrolase-type esterase domain-containing protein n=1 Tax=Protomyces lactucae-debilis TaxID=2754530 RepID=A0A1Y2FC25_PROLT|nr:SGNH hydrolase-type esterase domain-containing protein [Protomyces lactucae-debilis]ORY81463.1 SGNH hydrolase-type esterase domain-containing protein [Protomyces lactucae-debilis]
MVSHVWLVLLASFTLFLQIASTPSRSTHASAACTEDGEPSKSSNLKPIRFILAGDSTTAPPPTADHKTCGGGWGDAFLSHLLPATDSLGLNRGVCGSDSSQYREEHWADVLEIIKDDEDDFNRTFVTIAFGHNDQKHKVDADVMLKNLIHFVDSVRLAGAQPVLVTPLSRTSIFPDGHVGRNLRWARNITQTAGNLTHATVLDLTTASRHAYEAAGYKTTLTYRRSAGDSTHLSSVGAEAIGKVMCTLFRDAFSDYAEYFSC